MSFSFDPSPISLGCMNLAPSNPKSIQSIQAALAGGITCFDTADLYHQGENEKMLGEALGSKKYDVTIVSKGGNDWTGEGDGWNWNPKPEYLSQALDNSLRRLNRDYLDVYLLHGGTIEDPIEAVIDFMETSVQAGKIRAYGISSIRPNVIRKWARLSNMSVVMTQYGILDRRGEEEVLPLLEAAGIGVMARGVLGKGYLLGKEAEEYLGHPKDRIVRIQRQFGELCSSQSISLLNAATSFSLQESAVKTAVLGASRLSQVQKHLKLLSDPQFPHYWTPQMKGAFPVDTYQNHR
ncbi:aldo/keto reductase [Pontibacter sp. G13]|uniref:aldo/keto reductase n=1 Tax=Pontibacter sp. G13 TaxID=3074898 RepID=UPI002889EA71|nr:aldo/keto reductase [Pontibacter sp. G13]WNJ18870.1 aldo/keto reductase [Pontibacter sp. G13]